MTWAILLAALIAVESGGNPAAIGDNGRAVGILQIHAAVVADVNRIAGTRYTLEDRRNPVKSRQMCLIYLQHYGRGKTWEQRARIWNGGPRGHEKKATEKYWEKVKREIEEN
jgi:soluble lytic murein transglycosylase-like protein